MMSEFEKLIQEVQEKAAEMARKEATEKARDASDKFTVDLARRLAEASFLTDEQRLQLFGGTMKEYQKALAKSRKRT